MQAAMGACFVCAADTSVQDELPPRALELLANALISSVDGRLTPQ